VKDGITPHHDGIGARSVGVPARRVRAWWAGIAASYVLGAVLFAAYALYRGQ